jgi:uncharacterized protein YjdB
MKRLVFVPIAAASLAAVAISGCGDDGPTGPSPPSQIEVSSPIGSLMALGRTVQLSATARDNQGNVVTGVQVSWGSSNEAVARVSTTGLVESVAEGNVTVTATAAAAVGTVSGTLQLRVVAADLDGIGATLSDPFTQALVSHMTDATQASMQAALAGCSDGVSTGSLEAIQECLASAESQVGAATEPDDQALGAVLVLFLDHAEQLLNL